MVGVGRFGSAESLETQRLARVCHIFVAEGKVVIDDQTLGFNSFPEGPIRAKAAALMQQAMLLKQGAVGTGGCLDAQLVTLSDSTEANQEMAFREQERTPTILDGGLGKTITSKLARQDLILGSLWNSSSAAVPWRAAIGSAGPKALVRALEGDAAIWW